MGEDGTFDHQTSTLLVENNLWMDGWIVVGDPFGRGEIDQIRFYFRYHTIYYIVCTTYCILHTAYYVLRSTYVYDLNFRLAHTQPFTRCSTVALHLHRCSGSLFKHAQNQRLELEFLFNGINYNFISSRPQCSSHLVLSHLTSSIRPHLILSRPWRMNFICSPSPLYHKLLREFPSKGKNKTGW
jgi:hypothetical protein